MKFPWIECADTCRRLDNTKVHEAHEGHEVYFSCSSCPSCAFVASCRQRVQLFLSRSRRQGDQENLFLSQENPHDLLVSWPPVRLFRAAAAGRDQRRYIQRSRATRVRPSCASRRRRRPAATARSPGSSADTGSLKNCITRLRNVDSVFDAYRVTTGA